MIRRPSRRTAILPIGIDNRSMEVSMVKDILIETAIELLAYIIAAVIMILSLAWSHNVPIRKKHKKSDQRDKQRLR